ncbi:MAG TPA: cytidine deaminase [Saprospiraceae bacterium]|nr:cytidine deaminase [Saprospiraceae bacterium]
MKEHIFRYEQHKSTRKLTDMQRVVLKEAKKALKKSYSPYSGFQVAAAIELANGEIISGANYENAAYPLCLCAERVALAAAAAQFPNVKILRMAVTVKSKEHPQLKPAAPCGACRQVILETENKQRQPMEIILQAEKGDVLVIPEGRSLLPFGFDGDALAGR